MLARTIVLCFLGQMICGAGVIRVRADAAIDVPSNHTEQDTGRIEAASASATAQFSGSFPRPGGVATSNGVADANVLTSLGALHAYTSASTDDFIYSFPAVSADARAEFRDLLTVHSSVLAAGTPVTLQFALSLSGLVSGSGGAVSGQNTSEYSYNSNLTAAAHSVGISFSGRDAATTIPIASIRSFTVTSFVGDSFAIDGYLQIHAWVAKGGSAISDFSNTAHYFVDSLTSGAFVLGETGANYATVGQSVPEPSLLPFFPVAVLALLLRAERPRRGVTNKQVSESLP